jgi:hypothetical protein
MLSRKDIRLIEMFRFGTFADLAPETDPASPAVFLSSKHPLENEKAAMAQAKPLIDIKSSRFQEGYKGSTEALPPMRTAPAASVVVKVRPTAPANTNQR